MQPKHLKLMIPGPIEVEDEVLEQMGAPIQAHYGDAWLVAHNETIALLKQIMRTSGKAFMMPGSGTLGNDAAIQSMFAPGDHIAVGVNGTFGARLVEVSKANGLIPVPVEVEPGKPLDPDAFERALTDDPAIRGVAVVHLETSTAILNPIREIAQVARRHNRLILVDAVSSLGGAELFMDDWGIDVCVSASQKALGGAPGLALIGVGPRAWEAIMGQAERPRSWYLDLRRWQWYVDNWGSWHPSPVTMPTSVILGFRAALQSLAQDGLPARIHYYEKLALRLRSGLRAMGMSLFVDESLMAPILTAAYCPAGVTAEQLTHYLADEHQIKIGTGLGQYKSSVIRIGHMGGAIRETDIDEVLAALGEWQKVHQAAY